MKRRIVIFLKMRMSIYSVIKTENEGVTPKYIKVLISHEISIIFRFHLIRIP